jgi:hypothetical protein
MRQAGLVVRPARRTIRTTDSHHADPVAPNLRQSGLSRCRAQRKVGWGYHGDLDGGGLALSRGPGGLLFPDAGWMGDELVT